MLSRFFIQRPIFASVISVVIVLIGSISITLLPIEQTPDITPPTVMVSAKYPGASAAVLAETVAVPIEQEVNGVENMLYMNNKCSDDGTMELTITFQVGTDIDMATVLVQNRVAVALPKLPDEVKREGVTTKKQSTNMVLMVNLRSPNESYDEIYLSNYMSKNIRDELARVDGVGEARVFGAKDYGMRIWLDPHLMKARRLTTSDVVSAIREQNVQVAAGQIGAAPAPPGQQFQYTVKALGRLSDKEQFENIIIKVGADERVVRLKDVARVELGAQTYNWSVSLDQKPSIGVGVYQLPGANSLAIAQGIRAKMDELAKRFPADVEYAIAYDTTTFVTASIDEVVETLIIAVILVIFTVWIFLQDLRTTLIPAVTIPVSLIGTFAVMKGLGMSINTLSLFGLVLAIGIVVDDAIVVVENTMRLIDEEGLSAKAATAKAMSEITGPVIATTLVLLAVFIPTAMMPGITGRMYRQFALTIATATVFSSVNALTLSPALCGVLLRPTPTRKNWFFRGFDTGFDKTTHGYMSVVKTVVRRFLISMIIFVGLFAAMIAGFLHVPSGFIPDEDQGYFMVAATLPDGATLQRTDPLMERIGKILEKTDGVRSVIGISGYSALDSLVVTNAGTFFVVLEPWGERSTEQLHVDGIIRTLRPKLAAIQEANVLAFGPPPITGLGNATGFEFQLQDSGDAGLTLLDTVARDIVTQGTKDPVLTRMNSNLRATVPQLFVDVDRVKAKKMNVPLNEIFGALQAYLGSAYVNDFNKFGRVYRVLIQADGKYRSKAADIKKLEVRTAAGKMVPLSTLITVRDTAGPQAIFRFNQKPSATITGQPRAGYSSGDAVRAMDQLAARTLPTSMSYEWSGVTRQQIIAGNLAPLIFGLAIILVYLFLAAQYESWTIPLAVMLSVPLALLGAVGLTWLRGYDNNIYTQIGLVLLIGMASKNAILIVEFAKQQHEEGAPIVDAAIKAAQLRFRAILMTAFSFILGVIPLVIASGAGSASRRALGTAVFGGMLAATVFGIFFIPVLYVVVQSASEWLARVAGRK